MLPILATREQLTRGKQMVACPYCTAKFASMPELERKWIERHIERSHVARVARIDSVEFEPKAA